jgi:hypothetical protein
MRLSSGVVKFGNFAGRQTRQPMSSFSKVPHAVNCSPLNYGDSGDIP